MSISSTIKSIQDIMRKDVGVDGDAQRIGQLVWMFFLKIYDDKETEYELLDDNYRSPIPDSLRWRNWAADQEGMTGDELLDLSTTSFSRRSRTCSRKATTSAATSSAASSRTPTTT